MCTHTRARKHTPTLSDGAVYEHLEGDRNAQGTRARAHTRTRARAHVLKAKLSEAKTSIAEQQSENEKLRKIWHLEEKQHLEELKAAQEEADELRNQLHALEQNASGSEKAALDQLEQANRHAQSAQKQHIEEQKQLRQELDEAVAAQAEAKLKLEEAKTALKHERSGADVLERALEEARSTQYEGFDAKEKEIEELKKEIEELKKEIERLKVLGSVRQGQAAAALAKATAEAQAAAERAAAEAKAASEKTAAAKPAAASAVAAGGEGMSSASGNGLVSAQAAELSVFVVELVQNHSSKAGKRGSGAQQVEVFITGPSGKRKGADHIFNMGENKFEVQYVPKEQGPTRCTVAEYEWVLVCAMLMCAMLVCTMLVCACAYAHLRVYVCHR